MLTRNPFSARTEYGNTIVESDGYLRAPGYPALAHVFMRMTSMSERSLVESLLLMEAAYAALAILITVMI